MSQCKYLSGEALKFRTVAEARKLIGFRVIYLKRYAVDPRRGLFFPHTADITGVYGRHIELDGGGNYHHRDSFYEMTLAADQPEVKR